MKIAKLSNELSPSELREFDELGAYLYQNGRGGGPIPSRYREISKDPRAPHDSEGDAIRDAYKPAMRGDLKDSPAFLAGDLARNQQEQVNEIAYTLQLPAEHAESLAGQVAQHLNSQGELDTLDEAGHQECMGYYADYFNSHEEAMQTMAKARGYLEATLTPQQLDAFDRGVGQSTLAYDPHMVRRLASLFDVRYGGQR